jgi:hypothetical protein
MVRTQIRHLQRLMQKNKAAFKNKHVFNLQAHPITHTVQRRTRLITLLSMQV